MDSVLILLTSYNGEKYVGDMIESLLAQDYENIKVILSDDKSTDNTACILSKYADQYPEKLFHYRSGKKFGNAQSHFLHLLEQFHDADYIMFCDQDDIWHKDKISKTLLFMKELEANRQTPVLVHTDLHVVDQNLDEICPSFCQYSNIDGSRVSINQLLVHNVVTGCTVMLNRALASLAIAHEIPTDAILMHDWWLAILAAACGKVGFLDEKTIEYRQHNHNTVGAKNVRSFGFLLDWIKSRKMKKSMDRCVLQAEAFLHTYQEILPDHVLEMLKAFVSTKDKHIFGKDLVYIKYKILKYGFTRRMAQLFGL